MISRRNSTHATQTRCFTRSCTRTSASCGNKDTYPVSPPRTLSSRTKRMSGSLRGQENKVRSEHNHSTAHEQKIRMFYFVWCMEIAVLQNTQHHLPPVVRCPVLVLDALIPCVSPHSTQWKNGISYPLVFSIISQSIAGVQSTQQMAHPSLLSLLRAFWGSRSFLHIEHTYRVVVIANDFVERRMISTLMF